MIQDIFPNKFDNSFKTVLPGEEDYVFIFDKNKVIMKRDNEILTVPTYKTLKRIVNISEEHLTYLFEINNKKFYLLSNLVTINESFLCEVDKNIFRKLEPEWMAFAGVTASHLYHWYNSNKYCGKCGSIMDKYSSRRALCCSTCDNVIYPSISPAVIVGITNGDKILLTKYSAGIYRRYALIAGFVEIGETLEDTVRREVLEEVGLKVKNIRYYKSQPWGFSNSLLMGFYAELDGEDEVKLDKEELSEATWFRYDEIPESESKISLTSEMIEGFRNSKKC